MNLFSATLKRPPRRRSSNEDFAIEHHSTDDVPLIPPATDRELLTLWLEHKDTAALEAIILRHGPLVRSLSSRLLRSPHEQADAFQTVFLVVSQNASRIRHRESLASWIYGVTVRTCLMFSRQRSHEPIPEDAEAPTFPRPEVLEHQELVLTLNKELDLLPAHLRESLVLVYLEGHSRQSAADLTNTTEQTIKSRLARGRNLLRSRLLKRGVTFSTAFTIFSVTTTSEAANLTISDQLLLRTIDTCQTGQLPLSFPAVPLDPIAIVPTGAPMISSTTVYGGLAVATLLLLTSLGMGNHGRADGPTQQSDVNTAVSDDIEIGSEFAATIVVDEPPVVTPSDTIVATMYNGHSYSQRDIEETIAWLNQNETTIAEQAARTNSDSAKSVSKSMELQLLELEIETLKGSISSTETLIERAKNEPEFLKVFEASNDESQTHEERLRHLMGIEQPNLETSKQQLAQAQQRQLELIAKSVPEPQEHALAEIEVRRLDSLISQKKELYERMLLAKLYYRNGRLPPDSFIDNRVTSLDPEKTNELKFEILKLAIEKQQAEQALLSIQNREATQPHLSFVGAAVRTVEPPTNPAASPTVADTDLSRNPTLSQPAVDLPPIKQHEQSLLDLKVERAEMREKNARELAESGSGLASSNDLKLRLMDAKIALQEALLEREQFRAKQGAELPAVPSGQPSPIQSSRFDNNLSHTDNLIQELRREKETAERMARNYKRMPQLDRFVSHDYQSVAEGLERKIDILTREQSHKGKLPPNEPAISPMQFVSMFRDFRIHYVDANGMKRGSYGGLPALRLGAGRHEIELIFDEQQYWPSDFQHFRGSLELYEPSVKTADNLTAILDKELCLKLIEGEVPNATMIFWMIPGDINPQAVIQNTKCEALQPDQSEQDAIADIESKQGKLLAVLRLGERLNQLNPSRDFTIKKD